MKEKKRRLFVVLLMVLVTLAGYGYEAWQQERQDNDYTDSVLGVNQNPGPSTKSVEKTKVASEALQGLEVKGRAPKTGYTRAQFGEGWANAGACDVRNFILNRDLTNVVMRSSEDCTVVSGVLVDPYTGKSIQFQRGEQTSDDIQIDHVVALSDAWQKGAQQLPYETRVKFANDALNLLAVDGASNQAKSDSDAASWLPSNKSYRCMFVARQVAVKQKYELWVTQAEKDAIARVLSDCPDQRLLIVSS